MEIKKYDLIFTFIEPLLGTVPKNKEIYTDFVASKAPKDQNTDDEIEAIIEDPDKGITGFHVDKDGNPALFDYVIKGFFKDTCSMLKRASGTKSKELKAHKKVIDGLIFISPRMIPININGKNLIMIERPLRGQTAKGERIALAKSESAPAGSSINFELNILGGVSNVLLKEWLDYGSLRGLGQWRNAGYGVFTYEMHCIAL